MAHWYDPDTKLLLPDVELKTKPGEFREANLADARKVNALPSVTTILNLLSKPGLVSWQLDQVAKAAWERGDAEILTLEDWTGLVVGQSKEFVRYTSDFGTAVHWWLSHKLKNLPSTEMPPIIPRAEELADALLRWFDANGFEFSKTEHTFVDLALGFAGTVDLIGTHHGEPCIVDVKTQSWPAAYYDEHPLQLAAYRLGCGLPDHKLISVIANRDDIGLVAFKEWTDGERWTRMFGYLLNFWFLSSKYDPRC